MRDPREHPLLMRPELVRATLAGRKTQTRRLVTPGTSTVVGWTSARAIWPRLLFERAEPVALRSSILDTETPGLVVPIGPGEHEGESVVVLPRVRPGDSLWVREAWQTGAGLDDMSPASIAKRATDAGYERPWAPLRYPADGREEGRNMLGFSRFGDTWGRTRIGMHLPRWACRLVLGPLESVRGERARDVSEADALAEGVLGVPFRPDDGFPVCTGYTLGEDDGKSVLYPTAREAFIAGFDTINGHRHTPAGDWVWVYPWPAVAQESKP
jgi:hypothetical protein